MELGALCSSTLISLEIDGQVFDDELQPLLAGSCPALRELVLHDVAGPTVKALEQSTFARQLTKLVLTAGDADHDQAGE